MEYKMLKFDRVSILDLKKIAGSILTSFSNDTFFIFKGKMGSGKTTLIKMLCEQLNVTDTVTSPTFALINEYKTITDSTIYHFDFYRINSPEEAYDFGYEEYFYGGNICFIEWPEKIVNLLPDSFVQIEIEINEDETREFRIQKVGN